MMHFFEHKNNWLMQEKIKYIYKEYLIQVQFLPQSMLSEKVLI